MITALNSFACKEDICVFIKTNYYSIRKYYCAFFKKCVLKGYNKCAVNQPLLRGFGKAEEIQFPLTRL